MHRDELDFTFRAPNICSKLHQNQVVFLSRP